MSDSINVYWAPWPFTKDEWQWNYLYSEPKNVYDNLISDTEGKSLAIRCPATRDLMKNLYSFHSCVDDSFSLSSANLGLVESDLNDAVYPLNVETKVGLFRNRKSSYSGYVNAFYNLSWILFSDEPLLARWSAPYYPAISPVNGAIFTMGQYDIGQWFRPINLDYQIPIDAEKFSISEGDPLAFLELFTDKKIIWQRFRMTQTIREIANEHVGAPKRYGARKSLDYRYKMFGRSNMKSIILTELKNNLIGATNEN